jgi:hypothetical protein
LGGLLILQTGPVTERLRVREIDDDEGRRLVRILRRGSGSVVTWRRPQMVLLSAQGMDAAAIAKVAFTSEDLWVPKSSSMSCDQAVFADQAADASLPSHAVLLKIDRFGQRF